MIDTHIHLTSKEYKVDFEDVIKNAKKEGLKKVVLIGCDENEINEVIEVAKKDKEFFLPAGGFHPVSIKNFDQNSIEFLEKIIIENKSLVAVGEIGLDYHWYPEEKEIQKKAFKMQIELAQKYDLPIIIHSREAYEDCYEILKKYAPINGVMHSFSSDWKMAKKFLEIGMHIGLSGPITFKNGTNQREVAKNIDLDWLLLETDGPYLTPVPFRGKRNRPEYIKYVAQEIALQKNTTTDEILHITEKNAINLFGKDRIV